MEASSARRSNGWGPDPLGWVDLDAWVRLTGADPRPAEIRLILDIDRAWMRALAARREAQQRSQAR